MEIYLTSINPSGVPISVKAVLSTPVYDRTRGLHVFEVAFEDRGAKTEILVTDSVQQAVENEAKRRLQEHFRVTGARYKVQYASFVPANPAGSHCGYSFACAGAVSVISLCG